MKTRSLRPIAISVAALFAIAPARGQNFTWSGGGADNNWTTPANWEGGVAPSANSVLRFGGSTRLTNTNDFATGTQFNGIEFRSGAGAFALSGNAINLGGDVTNFSSNNVTISTALTMLQNTTFNARTAWLTVNAVISGVGYDMIKTGIYTQILTRANTYTGATRVQEGALFLNLNATGGPNDNIVSTSSALIMGGSTQVSRTLRIAGRNATASSQTFNGTTLKAVSYTHLTLPTIYSV